MNITEAKALFFAQYLGQPVLHWERYHSVNQYGVLNGANLAASCSETQEAHLLLRTVEQLTDEEYIDIANINGETDDEWYEDQLITMSKQFVKDFLKGEYFTISFYQYLLRIGILLPFTYLNEENKPVTLSPDDMVKLGWVKIKE